MTFALEAAFVMVTTSALIAWFIAADRRAIWRRRERTIEEIIATRYRQPVALRGWHDQFSSAPSVRTLQACYGAEVAEDAAHALRVHAGATTRGAAQSPLPAPRVVADRATSREAPRLAGRTSTGVSTRAARVG